MAILLGANEYLILEIYMDKNFFPYTIQVSAAFSVRLHEDTTLGDSAVIFETVDLNIGDGYDEFTGKT